ncbi:MAG: anti-sigma factor family protein, partial [Bacteroidota bacterium]
MKQMSEQELSHRLSQYVDGELSPSEALEVDAYLAAHPETTKELRELQAMKRILRAKEKLPANIGFWTRLSVALEHLKEEEQNFLPFPRRFIPAATALGLVSMVAVAVILFQQREALLAYLSKKTVEVQQAYEGSREGSFLKGVITPLLANIGRDEVLQFALFGTLSLDEQSETALRVDESSEKGYRIEFGKPRKGGSEGKKSSS